MDQQTNKPSVGMLAPYKFVRDDGDCTAHGYFLPKQHAAPLPSVCNSGVTGAVVDTDILATAWTVSSDRQKARLAALPN